MNKIWEEILKALGVRKPRVRLAEVRVSPGRPEQKRNLEPRRRVRDANLPYRR